jgi:hypothetical protein
MKIYPNTTALRGMLPIVTLAMTAMLAGCGQAEQTANSVEVNSPVGQPTDAQQALGQVMEFDGFTLRANITRAGDLNETLVRQYGIDPDPDLALLNLVILDNQSDRPQATVGAEVSAQYQTLLGRTEVIAMRPFEADGYVSYIGTLDAGSQRIFQLTIEAQPAGTDELLQMSFEVSLNW